MIGPVDGKIQNVNIVSISAYMSEETYRKCIDVGMVGATHKPIGMQALRLILNRFYDID